MSPRPYTRVPPLRNCVICGTHPRRTFSKSYQCDKCLAEAPALERLRAKRAAGEGLVAEIPF